MSIDKNLSDKFNIEPVMSGEVITSKGQVILPENIEDETLDNNINYDYDKTRHNLHTLLASGQEALIGALEVAKQSEHPRAFEVVGDLIKQLADVNLQLMDLSDKKQKLSDKNKKEEPSKQVTNNNAIFVGSTAELHKMINNLNGDK